LDFGPEFAAWHCFLAAIAVLSVLSLLHFVGCAEAAILDGFDLHDYPTAIKKTPGLFAYWRLGEPSTTKPAPPPPGGRATDEIGTNDGYYNKVSVTADNQRFSPPATGDINLGVDPGLLEHRPAATCIEVGGGYVQIPLAFDATTFSVEAWIVPEFASDPLGNFYETPRSTRPSLSPWCH
jgi:hypothetical protein